MHDRILSSSVSTSKIEFNSLPPSRATSPKPHHPDESLTHSETRGAREIEVARRKFDQDASVVLVGLQGSGKSSLALLAASAYNRRLVDVNRVFTERTGHSLAAHRQSVDIAEHHRLHQQVFEDVLNENSTGCVIVCDFSGLQRGSRLLRMFSQSHNVIHVVRDIAGIQSYVEVWTAEKTSHMLTLSGRLLRPCTNYEFFNCTENGVYAEGNASNDRNALTEDVDLRPATITPPAPFLRLKRAERDFLKFLRMILGDHARIASHQSAYPLSQIPVEMRNYTYAVVVTSSDILSKSVDLDAIQTGADAVQILFDATIKDSQIDIPYMLGASFAQVRRMSVLPVVVELDFALYGTEPKAQEMYLQHLRLLLRFAPEYIVVNMAIEDSMFSTVVRLKSSTKVIAQCTHIERLASGWDDAQCLAMMHRAKTLGCDMIQMSAHSQTSDDNIGPSILRARFSSNDLRLCAFNSGTIGRPSQCFNPVLTPVTASLLSCPSEDSAVSRITAKQSTQALFASCIYDPLKFYILGSTVQHSLSPAMHNAAYSALGVPHTYGSLSTDSLTVVKQLASDSAFGGASVTQPYKIEILAHVTTLSRHASIIRAVNTVLPLRREHDGAVPSDLDIVSSRNRAGRVRFLHGDNTDWIGVRACLRRGLSPINTVRAHSTGLVIGAGGMARASIYAMLHMGVRNIFIYSRTVYTVTELADYYNDLDPAAILGSHRPSKDGSPAYPNHKIHVLQSLETPWPAGYHPPTMIVSSIPPTKTEDGSLEAPFKLPTDWIKSPTGGVLLEHTYKPLVTELVRQVRAEANRGWMVLTGLDMLPEQAFAQFELFTGRRAPRRVMRAEVLRALQSNGKEEITGMSH